MVPDFIKVEATSSGMLTSAEPLSTMNFAVMISFKTTGTIKAPSCGSIETTCARSAASAAAADPAANASARNARKIRDLAIAHEFFDAAKISISSAPHNLELLELA